MIKYRDKKYNEIAGRLSNMNKVLNTRQDFSKIIEDTKDKLKITLKFAADLEMAKQTKMKLNFAAAQNRLETLQSELTANLLELEQYVLIEEQLNEQLKADREWISSVKGQEEVIAYNNINRNIIANQKRAIASLETVSPKTPVRKAPKY